MLPIAMTNGSNNNNNGNLFGIKIFARNPMQQQQKQQQQDKERPQNNDSAKNILANLRQLVELDNMARAAAASHQKTSSSSKSKSKPPSTTSSSTPTATRSTTKSAERIVQHPHPTPPTQQQQQQQQQPQQQQLSLDNSYSIREERDSNASNVSGDSAAKTSYPFRDYFRLNVTDNNNARRHLSSTSSTVASHHPTSQNQASQATNNNNVSNTTNTTTSAATTHMDKVSPQTPELSISVPPSPASVNFYEHYVRENEKRRQQGNRNTLIKYQFRIFKKFPLLKRVLVILYLYLKKI